MTILEKFYYILIGMLFAAAIFALGKKYEETYHPVVKEENIKPWFEISKQISDKLKSQYVEVGTKDSSGSGCQIKPGFYITALHVVSSAILDEETISVNNQKAQVVWKSKTEEDYVILTTYAEFDKKRVELPNFNNFGDNTNIIIVGSPGDQQKLVQPGKIIRSVLGEDNKSKQYAKIISAQYVDFGLSGGCVYSEDGENLLGILTNQYSNPGSTIGQITIVSRPNE